MGESTAAEVTEFPSTDYNGPTGGNTWKPAGAAAAGGGLLGLFWLWRRKRKRARASQAMKSVKALPQRLMKKGEWKRPALAAAGAMLLLKRRAKARARKISRAF